MSQAQKPWKPDGPFVMLRLAMLESEAWRSLDHNTRKFLERLEMEHMKHSGKDNGRLPRTYNDLVEYGMRRETIARSIHRAITCGFAKITRRGRRSAAGGNPTLYRLTYLPACDGAWPTDEWKTYRPNGPLRQTRSPEKAKTRASKIQNVGTDSGTLSSTEIGTDIGTDSGTQSAEKPQKATVPESVLLSRSSTHLVSEWELVGEKKESESLEACTEVPAAGLDIPTFLRRGHPDCWLKE